jgi:hypothetical protein
VELAEEVRFRFMVVGIAEMLV